LPCRRHSQIYGDGGFAATAFLADDANHRNLFGHAVMPTCGFVKMFKCPHVRIIDSLSRTEIRARSGSAIVSRLEQ
jgi:hypothetical protein